jgi:hypothetical protein
LIGLGLAANHQGRLPPGRPLAGRTVRAAHDVNRPYLFVKVPLRAEQYGHLDYVSSIVNTAGKVAIPPSRRSQLQNVTHRASVGLMSG